MLLFLIVIAAAATAQPPPAAANPPSIASDICRAMVPPSLASKLLMESPDHQLASIADVPVERLMATAAAGGWPCPFVAIGDFDGDGNLDRALVLKHKSESSVRLIAARNDGKSWRIEIQKDWPIPLSSVTVEPIEAGLYDQTKGGKEAAKQIDNLKSLQSDHPGFTVTAADNNKQAFFYINEKWDDIWLPE